MLTKCNIIIYLILICSFINLNWCSQQTVKYQTDCKINELNETELIKKNRRDVKRDDVEFYPKDNYYQCPGGKYPNDYLICCGDNECCQISASYIIYPINKTE